MKTYKEDQLVVPCALPFGMAIRLVADELNIPYAQLVRTLIGLGIENSEHNELFKTKNKQLSQLNRLELLRLKQNRDNRTPGNKY